MSKTRRRAAALCVVAAGPVVFPFVFFAVTAPASARRAPGPFLDRAVAAWHRDPIYVHPTASPVPSPTERELLSNQIVNAGAGPVYVAVLPKRALLEAGGNIDQLLALLGETMGRPGTYALVVGREFRAGSTEFDPGVVPAIAEEAVERSSGKVTGVLSAFIEGLARTAQEQAEPEPPAGENEPPPSANANPWPVVLVALGVFFGWALWRRATVDRRQAPLGGIRRLGRDRSGFGMARFGARSTELDEVRQAAAGDLEALEADLQRAEFDLKSGARDVSAHIHLDRARKLYEAAGRRLHETDRVEDLAAVSADLAEARYHLACARTAHEGRHPG